LTISTKLGKVVKQFVVPRDKKISLKRDFDPGFSLKNLSNDEAKVLLQHGVELLAEYQDKLYAQQKHSVLIILQAMDAAGKDGTIKHVMSGINPQGCQVFSFKAPNTTELAHDYLWRCVRSLPKRGFIGIFNRSYYEEVLIARVHPEILKAQNLPPEDVDKQIWKRRFEEINNFEKYLTNNGTTVIKFFLYVSKEEQKRRFLRRIERADKNWKFSASDAKERGYWDDYIKAYEDCFSNTSTKWAPWYVIPADNKPFTRLAVAHIIYEVLKGLNPKYPIVSAEQKRELAKAGQILNSEK
jgi:PPK2 family polyphosphate:nucleotide phosphotransferase